MPARPTRQPSISILPPGARTPDIPSPLQSWSGYLDAGPGAFRPYAEADGARRRPSRAASLSVPGTPVLEAPASPIAGGRFPPSAYAMHHRSRSEAPSIASARSSLDYTFEVSGATILIMLFLTSYSPVAPPSQCPASRKSCRPSRPSVSFVPTHGKLESTR
jgi:hypothetical protein